MQKRLQQQDAAGEGDGEEAAEEEAAGPSSSKGADTMGKYSGVKVKVRRWVQVSFPWGRVDSCCGLAGYADIRRTRCSACLAQAAAYASFWLS